MLANPMHLATDHALFEEDGLEVFQPVNLLNRCLGKLDFAHNIVDRFLGVLTSDLQALEMAQQAGDATRVAQIAHRLKGAAASISADRLRSLAAELEAVSRQQCIQQVQGLLYRLREEADDFARAARQWRASARATTLTT